MFLNVVESQRAVCNGMLLRVNDEELARLQQREAQYDRIEVTEQLSVACDEPAYTFVGQAEHTVIPADAVIAASYVETVERGLAERGRSFAERFHQTTEPSDLPVKPVHYRFPLESQNRAAGRRS